MVSITTFLSTALLATLALAQAPTTNFSTAEIQGLASSTDNPNTATKLAWCSAQIALCGTLCNGNAPNNTCDRTSLSWTCNCANNNSAPAMQYYQTSMLTFECNALLGKCLASNANDLGSQDACKKKYICGNATEQDAGKAAAAVSASTSSASSSPTAATSAGSGGAGVTSSVAHAGAAAYGDYAPPMFIMMMVGAIASFL